GNFKFSASDMLNMYLRRGKQIFSRNLGLDPTNSVYPLSFVLNHFFGNVAVSEIKKRFLFVSYDLKSESQYLFTDTAERFRDLPLSKLMIACSAYPGIYPPLTLGNLELADGIVAAKNPSELAYNYAKLFYPNDPIILLSLGTGQSELNEMDLIDKEMEQVHQRMERIQQYDKKLLYFRMQPLLKNNIDIDTDITDEAIAYLIKETEEYMKTNKREVKRLLSLIKIKVDQIV
ncbi:MAG: hypothetical protein KJ941_11120, partial [Bacteroidetes bacterium]|nr:hypothetical protein [Bacteroidota bacterium]